MDPAPPSPRASDSGDFVLAELQAAIAVSRVVPTQGARPRSGLLAGWRYRPRHLAVPDRPARQADRPLIRRRPALGLAALVVLSLLAAFFAWVTAAPLWLALGHGDTGMATVISCVGDGIGQRCTGDFTASDGTLVERVTLLGVGNSGTGNAIAARMVERNSDQAYVGAALQGLHLRWLVGLGLILICGFGIAIATGALSIPDRRTRRLAVATSLCAPLLLMIGFLAASF